MNARSSFGWMGFLALFVSYACGSTDKRDSSGDEGTTIGASGGEVHEGALTMTVPAGGLSAPVAITAAETSDITVPAGLHQIGPAYDLGPDGTQFAEPVTIVIELDASASGAINPALYQSSDGTSWDKAENSVFASGQVTGQIYHFSFVAPFASDGQPGSGGTGGMSGGVAGESGVSQGGAAVDGIPGAAGAPDSGSAGASDSSAGGVGGASSSGGASDAAGAGGAGGAAPTCTPIGQFCNADTTNTCCPGSTCLNLQCHAIYASQSTPNSTPTG